MIIRQAEPGEYEDVRSFYHSLIDAIADLPYGAGWKKDTYPSRELLKESIDKGELYVAKDNAVIGAMVVNHECNDGYREFDWPTKAADSEIVLIHALGVHPSYSGKGVAKQMVRYYELFEYTL